jgi:hypothetical protein
LIKLLQHCLLVQFAIVPLGGSVFVVKKIAPLTVGRYAAAAGDQRSII